MEEDETADRGSMSMLLVVVQSPFIHGETVLRIKINVFLLETGGPDRQAGVLLTNGDSMI